MTKRTRIDQIQTHHRRAGPRMTQVAAAGEPLSSAESDLVHFLTSLRPKDSQIQGDTQALETLVLAAEALPPVTMQTPAVQTTMQPPNTACSVVVNGTTLVDLVLPKLEADLVPIPEAPSTELCVFCKMPRQVTRDGAKRSAPLSSPRHFQIFVRELTLPPKTRKHLSKAQKEHLLRWFGSHHDKPYPSRSQKEDIVRITVEINEPICVCQVLYRSACCDNPDNDAVRNAE